MIRKIWREFGFLIVISLAMACFVVAVGLVSKYQEKHPIEYNEIDGHEYVIYRYGFRGGITHSPKCHCLTNQLNAIEGRKQR